MKQQGDQIVVSDLNQGDDQSFTNWNGSNIGPAGRIYSLPIICGPDYPAVAQLSDSKTWSDCIGEQGNDLVELKVFLL